MRRTIGIASVALWLASCAGTPAMQPGSYLELPVAENALLVRYAGDGPNCRDHALLRAAEVAAARGYRYLRASTPPTMISMTCEVHVSMFKEKPECPNVVFYDVDITQRSLRKELAR
jgi:hypothetical protein